MAIAPDLNFIRIRFGARNRIPMGKQLEILTESLAFCVFVCCITNGGVPRSVRELTTDGAIAKIHPENEPSRVKGE